jgi:hypothetical protein
MDNMRPVEPAGAPPAPVGPPISIGHRPPAATGTNIVGADTPAKACRVCGNAVTGRKCNGCKSYQDGVPCASCQYLMPPGIARCPECKSFQNWRRHIPASEVVIALLVSLISVITGAAAAVTSAWNYRSRTSVHILGYEVVDKAARQKNYVVLAGVVNSGQRPAIVRSARIRFDRLSLKPVPVAKVKVVNMKETLLAPNERATLRLQLDGIDLEKGKTKPDVMRALPKGSLIVEFDVEETSWLGSPDRETRRGSCSTTAMEEYFKRYVPD